MRQIFIDKRKNNRDLYNFVEMNDEEFNDHYAGTQSFETPPNGKYHRPIIGNINLENSQETQLLIDLNRIEVHTWINDDFVVLSKQFEQPFTFEQAHRMAKIFSTCSKVEDLLRLGLELYADKPMEIMINERIR